MILNREPELSSFTLDKELNHYHSLTGLKLGTLRKDWLAPALMGSENYSSRILSTQWLNLIRRSQHRLSVSTIGSANEEDILTELSTTDVSAQDDMTSEGESPRMTRSIVTHELANTSVESDDFFLDYDNAIHPKQSRRWTRNRLPLAQSISDSRLRTVAECSRLILPESRENLNEAFLEKTIMMSSHSRDRYYSDSHSFLDKVENRPLDGPNPPKDRKSLLPRSKSSSMIETDLNTSGPHAGKKMVR